MCFAGSSPKAPACLVPTGHVSGVSCGQDVQDRPSAWRVAILCCPPSAVTQLAPFTEVLGAAVWFPPSPPPWMLVLSGDAVTPRGLQGCPVRCQSFPRHWCAHCSCGFLRSQGPWLSFQALWPSGHFRLLRVCLQGIRMDSGCGLHWTSSAEHGSVFCDGWAQRQFLGPTFLILPCRGSVPLDLV